MGSYVFGSLLFAFFVGVFVFAPDKLPEFKQRMLAVSSALLAGIFTAFMSGSLGIKLAGITSFLGNVTLRAGGGVGVFALVMVWWLSPLAPVGLDEKLNAIEKQGKDTHEVVKEVSVKTGAIDDKLDEVLKAAGSPKELIASPSAKMDFLKNAKVYSDRRDYANARKSYEGYFEKETADLYDSYLGYWELLEVEFPGEEKVRQLFEQLAEKKPGSRAARLVLLAKDRGGGIARLAISSAPNPTTCRPTGCCTTGSPRTPMPKSRSASGCARSSRSTAATRRPGTSSSTGPHPDLVGLKEFGKDAVADANGNIDVFFKNDAFIQLLFITLREKAVPKEITLKFPNGLDVTVPLGSENPLGPDAAAVAFELRPARTVRFEESEKPATGASSPTAGRSTASAATRSRCASPTSMPRA